MSDELDEEEALKGVFDIDPLDLQDAFCETPAQLAYWSHRYALRYRKAAAAKANEKQVVAAYREVARDRVLAQRGKATQDDVAAMLEGIDEVKEAREETIEAEYEKVRVFGIVDAIRTKKDMLISVGAHIRAEMDHDPSIRARNRTGPSADDQSWGNDGD